MPVYNITGTSYIDNLGATGTAGIDTYNINGGALIIDSDYRWARYHSGSSTLGNVTINPTLGGRFTIDATNVKIMSYSGGSGNTPAVGDTITQGGASAWFMAVYPSYPSRPVSATLTMPPDGWIKVKNVTGTFVSGAITGGLTATISGVTNGWIEVNACMTGTMIASRLGAIVITGTWYEAGITNGSNNQIIQMPAHMTQTYYPGVWVETTASSDVFEFWPSVGTSAVVIGKDDRGKVVSCSFSGGVTFSETARFKLPPSGSRVRVPNILLTLNSGTITPTLNFLPSPTLTDRYDFTVTGSADVDIRYANMSWWPSFNQAFRVKLDHVGILTNMTVSELASAAEWDHVGIGQEAANAQFGLTMTSCFAGGTINDCVFTAATLAASGRYITSITNIAGFTFNRCTVRPMAGRSNNTSGAETIINALNCNWNNHTVIGGRILHATAVDCNYSGTKYADRCESLTNSTNPMNVWDLTVKCNNININGLSWVSGSASFPPYTGIMSVSQCDFIKLRNIGGPTSASCLELSASTGVICSHAGNSSNIEIKRVYTKTTRTGVNTAINSDKFVTYENVWGDYTDPVNLDNLNFIRKGARQGGAGAAWPIVGVGVYGTHFLDTFTSDVSGAVVLFMNEQTADTAQYVSSSMSLDSGFTANAGLHLSASGDVIQWTWPHYIKGITAFASATALVSGTNVGNHTYEYDLDKGSGFSNVFKSCTLANLSGETGITASFGVKPKIKITCTVTNTGNLVTHFRLLTNCTTASQQFQYPLDTTSAAFIMTGIKSGSEVRIFNSATMAELTGTDGITGDPTGSFYYNYTWDADTGDVQGIVVIHSLEWQYQRFEVTFGSSSNQIPIQQVIDRQYLNPT
jgi:hypothetical protein